MSNFPPWNGQQEMNFGQPMQLASYQQRPIYQPQMPPVYQQAQYPAAQQQSMQDQFYCRPVASEEEGRAVPVDFSGKPIIMPHFNARRIYVKIFDPGSGSAIFQTYRRDEPEDETQKNAEAFAPMSMVDELKQTIYALQEEVRQLKTSGGKRKAQQEVTADEV